MPTKAETPLTDEQRKQLLENERFIAEVLAIRDPRPASGSTTGPFLKFLQSSAGTALITVVVGGLMGSIVSAVFQMYSKQREMQLSAYQQKLNKRQETIAATFDLIGTSFAPADTLYRFRTELGNSPSGMSPAQQGDWQKKWDGIRQEFEEARRKWSSSEKRTMLSLGYYFGDDRELKDAWKKVNTSLTAYFDYVSSNCRDGSPTLCKSEIDKTRTDLNKAVDNLGCRLESASRETSDPPVKCDEAMPQN